MARWSADHTSELSWPAGVRTIQVIAKLPCAKWVAATFLLSVLYVELDGPLLRAMTRRVEDAFVVAL
jgi:hypothetical protein